MPHRSRITAIGMHSRSPTQMANKSVNWSWLVFWFFKLVPLVYSCSFVNGSLRYLKRFIPPAHTKDNPTPSAWGNTHRLFRNCPAQLSRAEVTSRVTPSKASKRLYVTYVSIHDCVDLANLQEVAEVDFTDALKFI